MEAEFWHDIWAKNQIAFHESQPNQLLVKHFKELKVDQGSRVFVPLCGKTLDMVWLLSRGLQVVGCELSETAVEQFFAELEVEPTIENGGSITLYSAENIDIIVGDIFALSAATLGTIDVIYDRAALVALPEPLRSEYTEHLVNITASAKQLLITFEYDQQRMDGPPFSIDINKVQQYYSSKYQLTVLESEPFPDKLKGVCDAVEHICLLVKR